jgi:hypothetical protein
MTDREEKTIKGDCGHFVSTPDDLTEIEPGVRVCRDCAEYGLPDQDA